MDDVDEEEDEAPAAEEAPRVEMESESGGEKDRESAPSGEKAADAAACMSLEHENVSISLWRKGENE